MQAPSLSFTGRLSRGLATGPSRYAMAALYVGAGVVHFVAPRFYVGIMPGWLPWPYVLVAVSGVAEIALGMGVLLAPTRRAAAYLVAAMLVVFAFAIHIPMSVRFAQTGHPWFWASVLRLALQPLLVWWAVAVGRAA